MTDFIIGAMIVAAVGCAIAYIVKAKKAGAKCIGCPAGGNCASHGKSGGCACGCGGESDAAK